MFIVKITTDIKTGIMYKFDLFIKNRVYSFEVDDQGQVWLIEENERLGSEGTNYGQIQPARNIEDAKQIGRLMLYALGKIKIL